MVASEGSEFQPATMEGRLSKLQLSLKATGKLERRWEPNTALRQDDPEPFLVYKTENRLM